MQPHEELLVIAGNMERLANSGALADAESALSAIEDVAEAAGQAFSGSWQGYHANVYYKDLNPPPPGAHFSQEWGLMDTIGTRLGSHGEWREFDRNELLDSLITKAGNPDLDEVKTDANNAAEHFEQAKANIESIITSENPDGSDSFLNRLKKELEELEILSPMGILSAWSPKGKIMTRDTVVLGQGTKVPPHYELKAEVASIRRSFSVCGEVAKIARQAGSHLERKSKQSAREERVGTNVFIGHGRSPAWRELKDFVQDRLSLPWDEFNRTPVAGVTNQARLAEMLDAAAIAFVIMTAEDENAEGKMQARMNVVHEVGLFQGRLGPTRAIVILEDGCEEFSNIHGLGQIRFPAGNIGACFEEVRRVLERENMIDP